MSSKRHIVVTTDLSTEAEAAFPYAKEYAEMYAAQGHDVSLTTLYIQERFSAYVGVEYGVSGIDAGRIDEQLFEEGTEKLEQLTNKFFPDARAKSCVVRAAGPVPREIARYAADNEVDLIVIASHGRAGMSHLFLGSVAEKVLHGARCPVLVVPVKTKETKAS